MQTLKQVDESSLQNFPASPGGAGSQAGPGAKNSHDQILQRRQLVDSGTEDAMHGKSNAET
jgi:hypothetical protein